MERKRILMLSSSSCSQLPGRDSSANVSGEMRSSRVISRFLAPKDTRLLSFPRASFSFAILVPPTFHNFKF